MDHYAKILTWAESQLQYSAEDISTEKNIIKREIYTELIDYLKKHQYIESTNYSVDYSCPERNGFIDSMENSY